MLVQNPIGEGSALPTDPQHTPIILESSSSQPQKTQKHRKPKRKNMHVPQSNGSTKHVADEAIYKNDLHSEEVFVKKELADTECYCTIIIEEVTLAKALAELKALKTKVKWVFIQEPSESLTTTTTIISSKKSQDKVKGIMVEELVKPKKKEQIRIDEEATFKLEVELQAEFKEEQRPAREKAQKELEANLALIETWDDVQAKIDNVY
nr:hypothetical protein [Tanacetum cinerariifolium]